MYLSIYLRKGDVVVVVVVVMKYPAFEEGIRRMPCPGILRFIEDMVDYYYSSRKGGCLLERKEKCKRKNRESRFFCGK